MISSKNKKAARGVAIVVALFAAYIGPSVYQKAQLDREVDRLCAVDGRIKVYEQVFLSSNEFDRWGEPNIPLKEYQKTSNVAFFIDSKSSEIKRATFVGVEKISLVRYQALAVRKSDQKVLGEVVSYLRLGGDPYGPWHPSSYIGCSQYGDNKLRKMVFVKNG